MTFVLKKCKNKDCGVEFKQFNSLQSYCSVDCQKKCKKPNLKLKSLNKPIKKVSDKRKIENAKYTVLRIEFLGKPENKICFIDGCNKLADSIEHISGRKGFYDDWARENNISLFLDVRFWRPCCLIHNLELENNPKLSKQYQLSKIHGGKKQ